MTARTVRDNGDGTITTVDDGVERRSVTAPGGSAPDAVAVAPVEAADIVETDVMRRWRAHGHVEIEGVAGYDVYVGGDDETPGTLRIDANDPGNQGFRIPPRCAGRATPPRSRRLADLARCPTPCRVGLGRAQLAGRGLPGIRPRPASTK